MKRLVVVLNSRTLDPDLTLYRGRHENKEIILLLDPDYESLTKATASAERADVFVVENGRGFGTDFNTLVRFASHVNQLGIECVDRTFRPWMDPQVPDSHSDIEVEKMLMETLEQVVPEIEVMEQLRELHGRNSNVSACS